MILALTSQMIRELTIKASQKSMCSLLKDGETTTKFTAKMIMKVIHPFDEDYFLDAGIGELMLSTENMELSGGASSIDSSTWCSNQNKFSNILNNTRLPGSENSRQYKAMTSGVCQLTVDDVNYDDITKSILDINELRENSDTESQMVSADHLSGLESDDEFSCKPMAPTDMNHYYLSTNTDDNID